MCVVHERDDFNMCKYLVQFVPIISSLTPTAGGGKVIDSRGKATASGRKPPSTGRKVSGGSNKKEPGNKVKKIQLDIMVPQIPLLCCFFAH